MNNRTIENTVDAIIEYNNGIVVIDRLKEPYGYALPGGHLENGESLEDALKREVKEETELKLSSYEQFRTYSEPDRDPRGHKVSTVYIAKGYGKLKAGSDAKHTKIITLDQIDELRNDFAFDHYKILNEYRIFKKQTAKESVSITSQKSIDNLIWQVHYKSSYYDNDPRMPGTVPIDERYFFKADSKEMALEKVYAIEPKYKNIKSNEELEVTAIPLDNLMISRNSSNDGRLGWHSSCDMRKVEFSGEDNKKYKLKIIIEEK